MRIINYKPNQTLVENHLTTTLLSYGVPQVVVAHGHSRMEGHKIAVYVNSVKYSNTTNKHRNAYLRDMAGDNYVFVQCSPAEIQAICGLETR